jgi:hypothetical protein
MSGERHQLKGKDYEFGTWDVRTRIKPGVTKSLLEQLKDYRIKIAADQESKWKENGVMDLTVARRLERESMELPLW